MDVIRNVTVHDIYRATTALSECPYCQEMVTYHDHREHCQARAKAKSEAVPRTTSGGAVRSEMRIQVREHKTGSTSKIGGH